MNKYFLKIGSIFIFSIILFSGCDLDNETKYFKKEETNKKALNLSTAGFNNALDFLTEVSADNKDWVELINDELGYKIQYPKYWVAEKGYSKYWDNTVNKITIQKCFGENCSFINIEELFDLGYPDNFFDSRNGREKIHTAVVGGIPAFLAYKFTSGSSTYYEYNFNATKKCCRVSFDAFNSEDKDILDYMVSTFELITKNKNSTPEIADKIYRYQGNGLQFQYPGSWKVNELPIGCEISSGGICNIFFRKNDYVFSFRIRDGVSRDPLPDRTGIGAGELQKSGEINIQGQIYVPEYLVYYGKTKEVFYNNIVLFNGSKEYTADATLSYFGDEYTYEAYDLKTSAEYTEVEEILKSLKFINDEL